MAEIYPKLFIACNVGANSEVGSTVTSLERGVGILTPKLKKVNAKTKNNQNVGEKRIIAHTTNCDFTPPPLILSRGVTDKQMRTFFHLNKKGVLYAPK